MITRRIFEMITKSGFVFILILCTYCSKKASKYESEPIREDEIWIISPGAQEKFFQERKTINIVPTIKKKILE